MSALRFLIFLAWTAAVLAGVGTLAFIFTYGDCIQSDCRAVANRNMSIILGSGFVVYWAVALVLFRRWSR